MHHPQLFNRLLQYELADNDISQSVTEAFSQHLWYLTPQLVPLALFSSQVPISERQALAEALLEVQATSKLQSPQNRFGSGQGKPVSICVLEVVTWAEFDLENLRGVNFTGG